jgi:ATP-dependent 26S proteasome regulatory subunit
MEHFPPASPAGRKLAAWLRYNHAVAGIDFDAAASARPRAGRRRRTLPHGKPLPAAAWARLKTALLKAARPAPGDVVSANVGALVQALGLAAAEADIFRFVFEADRDGQFGGLCSDIIATRSVDCAGLVAIALGLAPTEVWGHVSRGPLARLNLVDVSGDGSERFNYCIPYRIAQAVLPPSDGIDDIERRLIGAPCLPQLDPEDYGHMARERDFVARLLRGALSARRKGINILLHGQPGTGKSEFCKMIAQMLGCNLFAVGEADENGHEPTRSERVDALRLAQLLAAKRDKSLLLFDEMEDVLAQGERMSAHGRRIRRSGSKVFFNRMLEQNDVPVLWTANSICEFDPAFLRRMTFVFEMKTLPLRARARLWQGLAQRQGLALPDPETETLARRHKIVPSVMSGAVQAVAMAGGTSDEIGFVLKTLAGTGAAPEVAATDRFAPELVNADSDLAALERALTRPGAPRDVAMCLYGPPGTGKSAFARHLAAAMGLDPLVKRGSELLSKWIGESEQKIAAAFAEAREDERVLIIDEAESFLWSRAGADRSWEVSMVNELLVAMETHTLPFVCTTNHLDFIDAAALRRFSFKLKFDFMTPTQTELAYRRFFGRAAPAVLREHASLTPGDLALVARKLRVLGPGSDNDAMILRMLEQEAAVKRLPAQRIGF